MNKFDYLFYVNLYPDLRHLTMIQAKNHYTNHGIYEGRIGHPEQMKKNMDDAIMNIQHEQSTYKRTNKEEEKINILIRTSNRPVYFRKCIQSILEQKYENYRIIICFITC